MRGRPRGKRGLYIFQLSDAIYWKRMADGPVITEGAFDSQNLAFWDALRGEYRDYHRGIRNGLHILTATSKDFFNWTRLVFPEYSPGRVGQLYTNQIVLYYRAPHIFLGFPTRYVDHGLTASTMALPHPDVHRVLSVRGVGSTATITRTWG